MNEIPRRGRRVVASAEQTDLEAHAGGAEPSDAQASIDYVGKAEREVIAAVRLGRDVEHWAFMDVEAACGDEVLINRSVEILKVAGVVDMPTEVVVAPSRRNRQKVRIVLTPFVGSFGHGKNSPRKFQSTGKSPPNASNALPLSVPANAPKAAQLAS